MYWDWREYQAGTFQCEDEPRSEDRNMGSRVRVFQPITPQGMVPHAPGYLVGIQRGNAVVDSPFQMILDRGGTPKGGTRCPGRIGPVPIYTLTQNFFVKIQADP